MNDPPYFINDTYPNLINNILKNIEASKFDIGCIFNQKL